MHKAYPPHRRCCVVNLTLAHLTVFPALQNGLASVSQFHRYVVMPGSRSNIRAGGAAGEEERDGAYYSQVQRTFFPQKYFMCFIS